MLNGIEALALQIKTQQRAQSHADGALGLARTRSKSERQASAGMQTLSFLSGCVWWSLSCEKLRADLKSSYQLKFNIAETFLFLFLALMECKDMYSASKCKLICCYPL